MDNHKKIKLLQEKAAILRQLLIKYQGDPDIAEVLKFMTPFFAEIENGSVVPPREERFGQYFSNEDVGFGYRRYPDVFSAFSKYAAILEDLISDPLHRQALIDHGEPVWWEQE